MSIRKPQKPINPGLSAWPFKAFVYWNLHRKCWSIRYEGSGPLKGKVVAHCTAFKMQNVELKVSEAGRQRVLRERRKNIHAGAYGDIFQMENVHWTEKARMMDAPLILTSVPVSQGQRRLVWYNPYVTDTFRVRSNDFPIQRAKRAEGRLREGSKSIPELVCIL